MKYLLAEDSSHADAARDTIEIAQRRAEHSREWGKGNRVRGMWLQGIGREGVEGGGADCLAVRHVVLGIHLIIVPSTK